MQNEQQHNVVDMLPVLVEEKKKLGESLEQIDTQIAKLELDLQRQKSRRDQIAGASIMTNELLNRYSVLSGMAGTEEKKAPPPKEAVTIDEITRGN
jgi:hypothetical protein